MNRSEKFSFEAEVKKRSEELVKEFFDAKKTYPEYRFGFSKDFFEKTRNKPYPDNIFEKPSDAQAENIFAEVQGRMVIEEMENESSESFKPATRSAPRVDFSNFDSATLYGFLYYYLMTHKANTATPLAVFNSLLPSRDVKQIEYGTSKNSEVLSGSSFKSK